MRQLYFGLGNLSILKSILLPLVSGCTTSPETPIKLIDREIDFAERSTVVTRSSSKPIWIDTDAACSGKRPLLDPDDCWALLYALNSPALNIRGISSVRGNSSSLIALKSINDVISRVNTSVKSEALFAPHEGADSKYISNADQDPNEAVKAMARVLERERLTIVAIGPLTNIARLIDWRPDLASNIDRIIVVAGQRESGRLRPNGSLFSFKDLNVQKDLEAFQRVLDSNLRITAIPFELAQQITLNRSDLKRLSYENAAARWISKRSRFWDFSWRLTTKVDGFHPYDLLAVSFAADPSQFQCEKAIGRLLPVASSLKNKEFTLELSEYGNIQYCINLSKGSKADKLDILAGRAVIKAY